VRRNQLKNRAAGVFSFGQFDIPQIRRNAEKKHLNRNFAITLKMSKTINEILKSTSTKGGSMWEESIKENLSPPNCKFK